jgi:hypothetical protein
MTPAEFIEFAGRLAAIGKGGEAAIRTIAGRAYYGAFHLALEFLADLRFVVPANANAHGIVRRQLSGSGNADAVHVAGLLGNLHSARIRADYRLADTQFASFSLARRFVEQADTVRSLLNSCRADPARTEIIDGIRKYLASLN